MYGHDLKVTFGHDVQKWKNQALHRAGNRATRADKRQGYFIVIRYKILSKYFRVQLLVDI